MSEALLDRQTQATTVRAEAGQQRVDSWDDASGNSVHARSCSQVMRPSVPDNAEGRSASQDYHEKPSTKIGGKEQADRATWGSPSPIGQDPEARELLYHSCAALVLNGLISLTSLFYRSDSPQVKRFSSPRQHRLCLIREMFLTYPREKP